MTLEADCRACGGKPDFIDGHHVPRHRPGCRFLAKVKRRGRHGRAPFPLADSTPSSSPHHEIQRLPVGVAQLRLVERHGPCPIEGDRCAFCGFLWAGHPAAIQNNPDPVPSGPRGLT